MKAIHNNYIKHIEEAHSQKLALLGFTAEQYVRIIISGFNQVRKGSGTSLLLIIFTETNKYNAATIDLNYCTKKGIWEIETAQPRSSADILKRELLWKRG